MKLASSLHLVFALCLLLGSSLEAGIVTSSTSSTHYGPPSPLYGGLKSSPNGKTLYEHEPIFSLPPRSGYLSYRIRVSGEKQNEAVSLQAVSENDYYNYSSWSSSYINRQLNHSTGFNEASTWRSVLVPIPPVNSDSGRSYSGDGDFTLRLSHDKNTLTLAYENIDSDRLPSAQAISNAAAKRAEDQLEVLERSENFYPSLFEAEHLPADWRAYYGFGSVTLTRKEWRALSESVRRSLLEYVRFGGTLRLQSPNAAAVNLPNLLQSGDHQLGMGKVEFVQLVAPRNPQVAELSSRAPALEQEIQEAGKASFFTILAVLSLGVVLGPLNLFWFTRGKRHRLFFTIPLISLGASLLFVGVILLQDGTGGSGERIAVVTLSPDFTQQGATATILQQQSSRTGALLATGFEVEHPLFMRQMGNIRERTLDQGERETKLNSNAGRKFSGDWFQSRQRQTYELASVVPSRLSIKLQQSSDGQLQVSNETGTTLSFIALRQDDQYYLNEGELAPGASATLAQAPENISTTKLHNLTSDNLNGDVKSAVLRALAQENQLVAFSPEADSVSIDTLESIRWKQSCAFFIQPLN